MNNCESCSKEYSETFSNCPFCNFIDFEALKAPFPVEDIQWRIQSCGEKNGKIWARVLAYVTNRAIQERLDNVIGIDNWKNEFAQGPSGGVLCGLSVFAKHGWMTKWDGAENTKKEAVKGGLSDAMKRAAVLWGVGRYLYNLDVDFAKINENGFYSGKTKEEKWFKWDAPQLPTWALPEGTKTKEQENARKRLAALPEKIKEYFKQNEMDDKAQWIYCLTHNWEESIMIEEIKAWEISEQFNQIDDKVAVSE
ncbi:MAG: hypothetical protein KOO69_03140 [Victivallales bacterium]|nr:hypothetical protein [Victivallales bacterium]